MKWEETISDNREPYLQAGRVDLVLASYSITDDRQKVVGQAGPYMVTGQQILVKSDSSVKSIDDLKGKEVCSVTGSTSLENVKAKGAKGVGADSYSECAEKVLDGTYPAMSTDGTILAGLAAQNEGEPEGRGRPVLDREHRCRLRQGPPRVCASGSTAC
ncbi:transporter substrate-binding domain-containing protein [Nocardioides sp. W3-2-3]|uniref:transporter substrate-binding domain-containing protein n=1 Tax=Nocardioides convexus TaxID=2712224 RepID=UPI0024181F2B|nr:transporter substrate-binding domain-containing protein [Nocardioides convexus]NHA00542.1 transporter substrate-binding domain-containing protein [Nocardioides convexus]